MVELVLLVVGILAAHGANARIARLIAEDEITQPLRERLIRRFGAENLLVRWAHCPWCCGWWTAWPITALAWFPIMGLRFWWIFGLVGWSVAHAAGRLNHNHGS